VLIVGVLGVVIVVGAVAYVTQPAADEAPLFTLTDIDGNECTLSAWREKVVVLDFFATWCGPCEPELVHLAELYETYSGNEVQIVSISVDPAYDTVERLHQFRVGHAVSWIIVRDTASVSSQYNIEYIPTLVIVDQSGRIRYRHVGLTPASELSSEIDTLLEGG
jgi:thiol-disulfide isomerase/thioredoxin